MNLQHSMARLEFDVTEGAGTLDEVSTLGLKYRNGKAIPMSCITSAILLMSHTFRVDRVYVIPVYN